MNNILLIARRELGAYFKGWTGYIIAALVLLIDGILFNAWAMGEGERRSSEVLQQFLYVTSGLVMIIGPLLSMRLIAEEKQTGTIALLASSPVRDREIILGKYLSALAFLAVIVLATVYMPLLIMVNGKISFGHMAAGYLGLLLLGASTLAIGTFGSALARSQVMAVITSGVLVVAILISWNLARITERPLNEFFQAIALYHRHFVPFMRGIVHTRDIVYYLMLIYFTLFAATRVLEARRWR